MKVCYVVAVALLVLVFCFQAQSQRTVCCIQMYSKPITIPIKLLKNYTIIDDSTCPRKAILLTFAKGRMLCVDPYAKYIKKVMEELDRRALAGTNTSTATPINVTIATNATYAGEAQNQSFAFPTECCFSYSTKQIPVKSIKGYITTHPDCPKKAVLLITLTDKMCADPDAKHIKEIMEEVDMKASTTPTTNVTDVANATNYVGLTTTPPTNVTNVTSATNHMSLKAISGYCLKRP